MDAFAGISFLGWSKLELMRRRFLRNVVRLAASSGFSWFLVNGRTLTLSPRSPVNT